MKSAKSTKPAKEYDVIGIGNALLDITANVDDGFLVKLGLPKGGMTLVDDKKFSELMKMISKEKLTKSSGGSTANVNIGVAKLGGTSVFIGKVGVDDNGLLYEKMLNTDGVKTRIAKDKAKTQTGTAITFITKDGQRTFAVYLGAAINLKAEDIEESEIKKAKILHMEGFILENKDLLETLLKMMKIAKDNDVLVSVDLADSGLIKRNHELFKKIVKDHADMVFANETEAEAFTGKAPEHALHEIEKDCKVCIVKLGSKGSLLKSNGKTHEIPIFKVTAVNSNGAGDAYAAGILYSIANNIPLEKGGKIAAYISAQVVATHESTVRRDLKEEIKQFLF